MPVLTKEKIIKYRRGGLSYAEIGELNNLSRQRVYQILIASDIKRYCFFCNTQLVMGDGRKYCLRCISNPEKLKGREHTRELVRVRDKHTCQDCGFVRTRWEVMKHNKKIEGLKGKIKSLDVHHLEGACGTKSYAYDKVEDMDRLITLCHKCHYNRPEHRVKDGDFSQKRIKDYSAVVSSYGKTKNMAQTARDFKVTRQRVSQILKDKGVNNSLDN